MAKIYDNIVIEDVYESCLTTALDMNRFITADYSLTEKPGNIKRVVTKVATGAAEDLAMGVGNTTDVAIVTTYDDYTVGTTQARTSWYDEEAAADGKIVEDSMKALSEKMANDFAAKAITEWKKATLKQTYATSIDFDTIVDAIGKLALENEEGLFMLVNSADVAALRKSLKTYLSYSEDFVRTGAIGSIAGVPIFVSNAVTAGEAIIATKAAVKVFVKKGTEIEQERDANTRKNTCYARKVAVVALADARKVVLIEKA